MRANNVIRVRGSNNINFYGNKCIGTTEAYAPAIQLENVDQGAVSHNIQVYENFIYNVFGPAIWLVGGDKTTLAKDITIRNNLITKCGLMPGSNKISGV